MQIWLSTSDLDSVKPSFSWDNIFSQGYCHKGTKSTKDDAKWGVPHFRIVNKLIYQQWLWNVTKWVFYLKYYFPSCFHCSIGMQLKINLEVHKVGVQRGRAQHAANRRCRAWTSATRSSKRALFHRTRISWSWVITSSCGKKKTLMNSVMVLISKNLENCHSVQQHNTVGKHSYTLMSEQRKIWKISQCSFYFLAPLLSKVILNMLPSL